MSSFSFSVFEMEAQLLCSQASVVSGKAKAISVSVDLHGSQEANTMTPQFIQSGNGSIDSELDQLTYSAYLLTLDPDLAFSAVMAAIDTSMEDLASPGDLLRRTIEISLAQLRLDASASLDRESFHLEALLYSDSSLSASKRALSLRELTDGNPILLLESGERIAFVLNHVLGYSIKSAAAIAQISEKEYHTLLRQAYLELASLQVGSFAISGNMLGQIALA